MTDRKTLPCGCLEPALPDPATYEYIRLEMYHSCDRTVTTYEKYERARPVPNLTPAIGEPHWRVERELYWRRVAVRVDAL